MTIDLGALIGILLLGHLTAAVCLWNAVLMAWRPVKWWKSSSLLALKGFFAHYDPVNDRHDRIHIRAIGISVSLGVLIVCFSADIMVIMALLAPG